MSVLTTVLGILALIVLAASLIYTYRVGKLANENGAKFDSQLNEKIQDHPYSLNPIFWILIIAAILSVAYIIYLTFTISW